MALVQLGSTSRNFYNATPLLIRNCQGWYDGSDSSSVTTVSGAVSQWNDKSGNARHAVQATAANRPTYSSATGALTFNDIQALVYTGSAGINGGAFCAYLVYRPTNTGSFKRAIDVEDTSNVWFLIDNTQIGFNIASNGRTQTWTSPTTITIVAGLTNGSTINYSYSGAVPTAMTGSYTRGSSTTSTTIGHGVGGAGSAGGFIGDIYEIVIYSRYLSNQEHELITGYLGWKWGTPATYTTPYPTTHSYYFSRPVARNLTPLDLFGGNTVLWLDGSDPTTVSFSSGTTVSYWRDKAMNGYMGVFNTGTFSYVGPTYDATTGALYFNNLNDPNMANGRVGLRLMGANGGVSSGIPLPVSTTNFVVYAVYNSTRATNTTENSVIQLLNSGVSQYAMDIGQGAGPTYNGPFQYVPPSSIIRFTTTTSWSTANQYNILGMFCTSTTTNIRMNGTQFTQISGTGVSTAADLAFTTIGAHYDNRAFTGYIREIIIIDGNLIADRDIERLEGYLAWKWGLTGNLPAAHAHKNYPPSVISPFPYPPTFTRNFIVKFNQFEDPVYRCMQHNGGTNVNFFVGMSSDSLNNPIVTGYYRTTALTIYNKDDVAFGTTLAANAANVDCGYLVKYKPQGTVSWVTRAICTSNSGVGLAFYTNLVDSADAIYVCGVTGFGTSLPNAVFTFYNNGGTVSGGTRTNANVIDGMNSLAKYTSAGNVSWLVRIVGSTATGGTARNNQIYALAVDSTSSNVFVGGWFLSASVTVYNADDTTNITLSNSALGNNSNYFLKYNSSGVLQNRTRITSNQGTYGNVRKAVCDISNNVLYCGQFGGTISIYTQPGSSISATLTSDGLQDGYIVKFDSSLNFTWAVKIGGTALDATFNLVTDTSNNVYASGYLQSATLNFYDAAGSIILSATKSSATQDAYLVKYNSSGTPQWVVTTSGVAASTNQFSTMTIDNNNNLYIHGVTNASSLTFSSVTSLPKTYAFTKRSSGTTLSTYVAIYDQNGQLINVRQMTSIGGTDGVNITSPNGIAVDKTGNILCGGICTTTGNLYITNS